MSLNTMCSSRLVSTHNDYFTDALYPPESLGYHIRPPAGSGEPLEGHQQNVVLCRASNVWEGLRRRGGNIETPTSDPLWAVENH